MSERVIHSDLGHCDRGEVIEVTLSGSAANVRLMDTSNLHAYRNGRQHRYHGGLVKRSPVRLAIPHSGRWHVTVDMQGLRGRTNASVRKLPQALPAYREPPLSTVPSLVHDVPTYDRADDVDPQARYDVFISHASEDKEDVARPLADALRADGLSVWYDDFSLRMGDSLRRSIDHGVSRSRFGVVILSRNFFRKNWTQYELDGLVTRAMSDEQIILPVWHEVTKQEVVAYSPSLADKVARSTGTHTITEIAREIVDLIAVRA